MFGATLAWAQGPPNLVQKTPKTVINYGNNVGMAINLNNSGFGLNGFWSKSLPKHKALIVEAMLKAEKDEKEEKYFDWWGNSYIPGKLNYMLALPIQVGIQKRLFAEDIDDNFRPYVQAAAGPTFAWVSPYFSDVNKDGTWQYTERIYDSISAIPRGKPTMGLAGGLGVGAQFGRTRRSMQALRVGVDFQYFPNAVQLMETNVQEARQLFVTPSISIIFGKYRD